MKAMILIAAILVLVISGCSASQQSAPSSEPVAPEPNAVPPEEPVVPPEPLTQQLPPGASSPTKSPEQSWKQGGVAVAGTYADADVIDIGNGRFRMYYSAEPEVPGFNGQVYSAVSSGGISWKKEPGERITGATFPSAIKLPDGTYRMYYQNQQAIKSAVSSDGLSWKQESGIRVDSSNNAGLSLTSVGSPTVIKSGDKYVMVYFGAISEAYPEKVPNPDTHLLLWAASSDGLTFEKKGIALDSRNPVFKGWLDGPDFVQWDDGSLRLYFWSYKGIYHVTFDSTSFSQNPVFDFTTSSDPMAQFPPNPPGDPTLAKIAGQWLMYYGQHTEGIFYAALS